MDALGNSVVIGYASTDYNTWCKVEGSSAVNDGKWHHLAYIYNNSNTGSISLYIDGHLEGTNTIDTAPQHSETYPPFQMMSSAEWGSYTAGQLDEFRIWNTARTEAQIKANMYKELQGNEANLVAYYKMSDGSGISLTDNSVNNNTGTIVNGSTWKASGAFGGSRQALDFDGTDDYVDCGNNASVQISGANAKITLEVWFKPAAFGANYWLNSIIDKTNSVCDGYVLRCGGNGKVSFNFGDGSNWNDLISPEEAISTDKWQHIASVYDGSVQKIYVNGFEVASISIGVHQITNALNVNLQLGSAETYPDRITNGQIDEVRIWNVARTQAEIQENMMKTLVGNEAGLAAYYRFDQKAGTTLYDMTSNGNNGTLTNMDDSDWVVSDAFTTWVGSENTSWSESKNWTSGTPTSSKSAGVYYWSLMNNPEMEANSSCNNIFIHNTSSGNFTIGNSYTLTIGNNMTIADESVIDNSGTFKFSGSASVLTDNRATKTSLGNILVDD